MEGGGFKSLGTQTPDHSRVLPTLCRGLRSPAPVVPRPPSVAPSLPSLHPVLGLDRIPEPLSSFLHSSPLASLQTWGSSLQCRVRPGPPPNAAHPSYFWDPAAGRSGNPLRLGSEGPTLMMTALA